MVKGHNSSYLLGSNSKKYTECRLIEYNSFLDCVQIAAWHEKGAIPVVPTPKAKAEGASFGNCMLNAYQPFLMLFRFHRGVYWKWIKPPKVQYNIIGRKFGLM
jgi:hypothetical protein